MTEVTVTAVPMGPASALECSECGPLEMAGVGDVAAAVRDHLEGHGCDLDKLRVQVGDPDD